MARAHPSARSIATARNALAAQYKQYLALENQRELKSHLSRGVGQFEPYNQH